MTKLNRVATAVDFFPPLSDPQRLAPFRDATFSPQARYPTPKVAIFLCTYHGQEYLAEQLESYAAQSHGKWQVYASDDGSNDGTFGILQAYRAQWGSDRLSIIRGPGSGFVANFLSLVCQSSIEADYFAYSDQDDIWEENKLQRAIAWLEAIPPSMPALYCSRTRLVDAENRDIGTSPLFSKPPRFANALMQNIGGGNTMVFNSAARKLLCSAGEDVDVVSHDWWTYLVVSGCGGRVFYDPHPLIRYRQHGNNMVGSNASWAARFLRIRMLWQGRFKGWNDRNIQALARIEDRLMPENRETLRRFARARDETFVRRLLELKRSGVYRQTLLGNLGLMAAAVFKKL